MKKVTVKSELIKKALSKLGAAVNNKVIPALENVYCKVEGSTIALTTCDTEMLIRYNLMAESDGDGEFFLSFHLFNSIVKLCKEEVIEFEPLKASVKVKIGKDVYTLKFNAKLEDFPKLSEAPSQHEVEFDDRLIAMMVAATESASKSETDPRLARICLNINYTGTDIVGTDSYILYKYNSPAELKVTTSLLLSPRMVKAIDGLEQIVIKWNDSKFSFSTPEILIVINRPEFKYPNYLGIIPNHESNLKISRSALVETFKKLNISETKTSALHLLSDAIKAEVEDKATGVKINAEVDCIYSGQVTDISLNAADILRLCHQTTCEHLELAIHSPNKAVVVRGEDPNYLALIIPTFK
ncbi:MAG: hypothetical protein KF862_07400 [Chitinophagaceae bacterium]|nr:hypothetical protein [Chitinophagaceae bacterium]